MGKWSVLITSFITGIFLALEIKTGVAVDERSISLVVLNALCGSTKGLAGTLSCNTTLALTIIFLLLSIWAIYKAVDNALDNVEDAWPVLLVGGIGASVGFLLVWFS